MRVLGVICAAVVMAGCGGSKEPAKAPEAGATETASTGSNDTPEETESASKEEDEAALGIPTKCFKDGDVCTPDPKWVKRLCNNVYRTVALHMFNGKSPWTRGYLTRKTKAWNASGGATSGDEWLAFDEEVILLFERKSDLGGMQVSGAMGGFDALRWDGSCVTLSGNEVTTTKAPSPKHARVEWRFLEKPTQEALRKDERIDEAYRGRRKECKGQFSGTVSKKCVTKDEELISTIVEVVGEGVELPAPETLP